MIFLCPHYFIQKTSPFGSVFNTNLKRDINSLNKRFERLDSLLMKLPIIGHAQDKPEREKEILS